MKTNRRGFLKVATGTLAAGAVGCKAIEQGYPEEYWVKQPPVPLEGKWAQGEERFVRSVCMQCEGGCGIVVRVVEGRAVKIDGNKDYPTNRGGLCPKGQNGLQVLYDPDRIEGPLARDGKRGEGKWKRISWDEALAQLARSLGALREKGRSHAVAVLGGRYRGHMRPLVRRFLTAYGSPNEIGHDSVCAASNELANYLTQGVDSRLAFDWEKTRYVLSFGAGLIESFVPTAMMLRVFGHMRAGAPGRRAKIVQVEPRQGVTASRADEWVPVKPGTDAALALGLAHVLVRERLYDRDFVAQHTHGFEPWTDPSGVAHRGFGQLVLESYSPKQVAPLTGVPAEVIERLAREFAAHQPGFAVSGRGAAAHSNGLYTCLAIHSLNALVGNLERPGGVMVQRPPPFATWPELELDEVARAGLAQPRLDLAGDDVAPFARDQVVRLAERLESGSPYPLEAVFLYYTNPLFSSPQPDRLRAALGRVPLVVSFSPFMDESTLHADLVLPDHTYLERWQLDEIEPSVGHPLFGIRQPVVAPLHDTRSTGEVLITLARALGGPMAKAFPGSELEMIQQLVRGVQRNGRGSIREESFEKFWEKLLAVGGWWDAPYVHGELAGALRTPSGKFELYAGRLEEKLAAVAKRRWPDAEPAAAQVKLLAELRVSARGDEVFLPHYEPVLLSAPAAEYPFVLNSYKTMTHAEGRGANQPHLQELYGVQFDRAWEPWVEVHPDDAHALGVANGDRVKLRSPSGEAEAKVVVHAGAARGVVNVPFEYGHTAYGRWAQGRGESVNRLLHAPQERLVGGLARYDARVAVTRV